MPQAISVVSENLRARAAKIRLAVFDVDGTLTDGRLWFDAQGTEMKAFHVLDGLGLRLLEDHGIAVAIITARHSSAVLERARDLNLVHVFIGVTDKLVCLKTLCAQLACSLEEVAYLGDDLPDLAVFHHVGLAAAPANAHTWVREQAHWITSERGGEGAARALCDLILETKGCREAIVSRFLGR